MRRFRSPELSPALRRTALALARRLGASTDPRIAARAIRIGFRIEAAIPTSRRIDNYLKAFAPDVVLTTGTFRPASEEVEFVKSARRLGIPSGVCVPSWDNLTNKGLLKVVPDRVFVWNPIQVREATELHGMPPERVQATGAGIFDEWFERCPSCSWEQLAARVGLDAGQPYLLYLCSSPLIVDAREADFVLRWIEALRSSDDERLRRIGVVIRPHPNATPQWEGVDLDPIENAALWPARGVHPVADGVRADFFDTLAHSAAVVGINTTAMIEAAIVGKSVLTVLVPDFAQESTLHFHYLLAENGGFLHVSPSLEEHVDQLCRVLDEDAAQAARRRRFVESFVRPLGIDRPATPLLADAIEDLAEAPVAGSRVHGAIVLRPLLGFATALGTLHVALRRLRARVKRR